MAPTVSVIIPSFNYAHYLPECVRSLQAQSFRDWEAIVVDDGSTDSTKRVLETLAQGEPRLRFFCRENGGVAEARNFGVSQSQAEFIVPLDADDVLTPNALEVLVATLTANPTAAFAHSSLENYEAPIGENPCWLPGPMFPGWILRENTIPCTALIRRSLFLEGIAYRELIHEDWDLWLQFLERGKLGIYIPHALLRYRQHPDGRHDVNRGKYYLAFMQEVLEHPSMYDENLRAVAGRVLLNEDKGLRRPSLVFLAQVTHAPLFDFFLSAAIEAGYFCFLLGERRQMQIREGLGNVLVEQRANFYEVAQKFGMLGNEIVLIGEFLPEEAEFYDTKDQVISMISFSGFGGKASLDNEGSPGSQVFAVRAEDRGRVLIAESPMGEKQQFGAEDVGELVLSCIAYGRACKKRTERSYRASLKKLSPATDSPNEILQMESILVLENFDGSAAQYLAQVREQMQSHRCTVVFASRGDGPAQRGIEQGNLRLLFAPPDIGRSYAALANFASLHLGEACTHLAFLNAGFVPHARFAQVLSCSWLTIGEAAWSFPASVMGEMRLRHEGMGAVSLIDESLRGGMLLSREAFASVGGFREGFVGESAAHVDLIERLALLGIVSVPAPEILGECLSFFTFWRSQSLLDRDEAILSRCRASLWDGGLAIELFEYPERNQEDALRNLFQAAYELLQQSSPAFPEKMNEFFEKQETKLALDLLRSYVYQHPEDANGIFQLARAKLLLGNLGQAGHYAAWALWQRPDFGPAKEILAALQRSIG